MDKSFASRISRRRFLTVGGVATAAAALPSTAVASDNGLFKVWVQLTTGAGPIRPSFFSVFADPMFADVEIWPLDYPAENFMRLLSTEDRPPRGGGPGGRGGAAGAPGGGRAARGGAGGPGGAASAPALPAPTNVNPPDYPWDPSGGGTNGVRSIPALARDPGFDVLVLNDQTEWPDTARANVQRAIDMSHGFVLIHHALGDNNTWPTWYRDVTGGLLVTNDHDGMKKSVITPNVTMDVTPVGDHPIVADLKPMHLLKEDAFKGMWQAPGITPLLQTNHPASDRVIAWIGPHPKARVVCIQVGASKDTHNSQTYRRLVHNSILWAAGRF